jgi:hypothetical protein
MPILGHYLPQNSPHFFHAIGGYFESFWIFSCDAGQVSRNFFKEIKIQSLHLVKSLAAGFTCIILTLGSSQTLILVKLAALSFTVHFTGERCNVAWSLMGQTLQGIKTAMVFLKKSCDTLWVLGGYPPGITGKRSRTQAGIFKNYTRKVGIGCYVFIRGLRFGRSLSWRWNCQLETSWNISYFNCLLVWCLNFPQRSRASMSDFFIFIFHYFILKFHFDK